MAWNGSGSAGGSAAPQAPKKKSGASSPLWLKGALAGLVVVAIGAAVLYMMRPAEKPVEARKSNCPKQIKVVAASAVTNVAAKCQPQTKEEQRLAKLKYYRDKYGSNIPENLKATVYFLENPPQTFYKQKTRESFLRHSSERMIASVVLVEPGTKFVIPPHVDSSFDRDFVNALVDKIEVNADDSEEVRAIKEGVSEIKKEIAKACKDGAKTPSEVFNEHAKAMYELGLYRETLSAELNKVRDNPDYSDADVEDFVQAANKMLESKGLAPMKTPDLAKRSFRLSFLSRLHKNQKGKTE